MQLSLIFRGISLVQITNGSSTLFWKDMWHDELASSAFPHAYSYTTQEDISVQNFLSIATLSSVFWLPLSTQAHDEVKMIQQLTREMNIPEHGEDEWTYVWEASEFKASQYYAFYFRDIQAHKAYKWLWKSKSILRIKVFGWFVLSDRLNTRNMLKRRHYNIGDNWDCLLCGNHTEETIEHMIFKCSFSRQCWDKPGTHWNDANHRLHLLEHAKEQWSSPLFMDIFLIAAWSLWEERNNNFFRGITLSVAAWKLRFKTDFSNLIYRVPEDLKPRVAALVNSVD